MDLGLKECVDYLYDAQEERNAVNRLQATVYEAVAERGYSEAFHERRMSGLAFGHRYLLAQFAKAVEELGEVGRCLFEGRAPDMEELADAAIPLLCMAEWLQRCDRTKVLLWEAVQSKVLADMGRGVDER